MTRLLEQVRLQSQFAGLRNRLGAAAALDVIAHCVAAEIATQQRIHEQTGPQAVDNSCRHTNLVVAQPE
jgi:hypothetical protein